MEIFDTYVSRSSFDEVYDGNKNVRENWKDVVKDIENAGLEKLREKQAEINWYLEDNGVTYNIYDDHDGTVNRSWSMDLIPFIIAEDEWNGIKKGLKQRAKLFNLIFKDLYSNQRLIKDNIIPAEVIFSHKGFASEVFDFGFKEDFNLYFYATDLARGPDGKMWVVSDKTQAPSGLGYAIENRLTMNSVTQDLYPNIQKQKLAAFLEEYKAALTHLSGGDIASVALFTPGPHNETYFEHAYLSSHLEIKMVQGEDLLVKNGSLWVKSLGGLQQINTLLRRVDDRYCDPLELKNDSQLGVAGLVEAMRQGKLNMMNPIGSAVVENVGLNPFMKKICQYFLQEDLILPQIATWWCGQKSELDYVIANLENLIIKKIDRTEMFQIYFGKKLSQIERTALIELLLHNPHKYVAQEEVDFSTVPYFNGDKIEPRNAVIRTYCLKKDEEYCVMNGGLVRVSHDKDTLLVSSKQGGISKDLWILGKDDYDMASVNILNHTKYVETSINQISTLKASNLFWLGRYLARAISTTRLIVLVVKKITNFYRYEVVISKESQNILQNALTHMTKTYPGFMDINNQQNLEIFPMVEITSIIKDTFRSGSLSFTIAMLSNTNVNLKDLLTIESWKLFEKMQKEWNEFVYRKGDATLVVASELDKFLIYLMAYKELVKESIFKEQGLILYSIGYKIEDALLLISKARSILCLKVDKTIRNTLLEGMLNSLEGFNAYRSHYKSSLNLENVIDFLLLNKQFPKSLKFVTNKLLKDFKLLPKAKIVLTPYEEALINVQALLESIDPKTIVQIKEGEGVYVELDAVLAKLSDLFLKCSNEFSNTYFSHYDE